MAMDCWLSQCHAASPPPLAGKKNRATCVRLPAIPEHPHSEILASTPNSPLLRTICSAGAKPGRNNKVQACREPQEHTICELRTLLQYTVLVVIITSPRLRDPTRPDHPAALGSSIPPSPCRRILEPLCQVSSLVTRHSSTRPKKKE